MEKDRSEAYDLSLFEPKRQELPASGQKNNVIKLTQEQLDKSRRVKIQPLHALATFLSMAVVVGIVGSVVYGQAQLNELTDQINTAQAELSEAQSTYTQLKMKSDSRLSLDTVEEYAKDTLGMRRISQEQVVCISLSSGDKGEVLQEDGSVLGSLWNWIQNLLS
ncbi:MAG TPA: cell division protein FtsL [Candidatus Gallacutalibacter pullicola]|uniref:Cell division protein FtsL n=1 Tax=Candidatus Gallacutalibacter pullicola TaxID=2840830 RepID=A0A9D1DQ06_9FIRM|nr:cell division protein FtsL [Candidatus Gallacutalibacter pullicola]